MIETTVKVPISEYLELQKDKARLDWILDDGLTIWADTREQIDDAMQAMKEGK